MKKYIVAVETNYDTEVACLIAPRKDVCTKDEANEWPAESKKEFPHSKYHLYSLEEVQESTHDR